MKAKNIILLLLLLAFQICYLEWPTDNAMFIYQLQFEVFSKTKDLLSNLTHPIILTGFIAQLLLIIGSFLDEKSKISALAAIILGVLVFLFFIVGWLDLNFKIILSTLPYLSLLYYYFAHIRKSRFLKKLRSQ
jgi:hypothetical protein